MLDILHREWVYLWYYFTLQLSQIFRYWVLGMVLGAAISVFAKDHIHGLFRSMHGKRLGVLGIFLASVLASTDPVALGQACIDLVYAQKDGDGASLVNRIGSRNGLHTLEHAEEIGLGSRAYQLVSIDQ